MDRRGWDLRILKGTVIDNESFLRFATPLKSRLQDYPRDRASAQGEGKHAID